MKNKDLQKGFALVELLLVVIILVLFTIFAVVSFFGTRKFKVDDQANALADMLAEARQYALNQRRVFRIEINKTKGSIILIDENDPGVVSDDAIVKRSAFKNSVNIGVIPNNILSAPTASSPIPVLDFVRSTYPLSSGDEKITLRFARDGRVLDPGTNDTGAGSIMRGATVYLFANKEGTTTPEIIRAITVLQASGDVSILKCRFDVNNKCGNWSR